MSELFLLMRIRRCLLPVLVVAGGALVFTANASAAFSWPNGAKAAVSLAYDDALPSQLDTAIPQLNAVGLKGSFYLPLSAEAVQHRLAEWRAAAAQGHELGNHTLFHQCAKSLPGRDWVSTDRDLDQTPASRLIAEIRIGNAFLQAIDGKTKRTFTAPCTDQLAAGTPYLPLLGSDFVAMKTTVGGVVADMKTLNIHAVPVIAPSEVSGAQLIAWVKAAGAKGTMVNFTFHGIGGDHLQISSAAHAELLQFLASHKNEYWTDTFLNLMEHVKSQQAQSQQR
ncbi:polysaccharide deacetylase family protein [Rheinheimera tilapiae]|uniref:Polysaccharide deacetylase family protein n=1 Tax=Rheinheimera tilapiae TaxID=875043 RepID=A0ABV6B8X7_9GAMM